MMSIKEKIKAIAKARGLRLKDVAKLAGVSLSTLTRISRRSSLDTFMSISDSLDVPIEELFSTKKPNLFFMYNHLSKRIEVHLYVTVNSEALGRVLVYNKEPGNTRPVREYVKRGMWEEVHEWVYTVIAEHLPHLQASQYETETVTADDEVEIKKEVASV